MTDNSTPMPGTALPWRARGRFIMGRGQTDTYSGPVWGSFAEVHSDLSQVDGDGRRWSIENDPQANAAYIVWAANNAPALLSALDIITLNAVVQPDARMGGSTDCYAVPLEDIERARAAIASARP